MQVKYLFSNDLILDIFLEIWNKEVNCITA